MTTNRIVLQNVLDPSEYEAIDRFCSVNKGVESLPRLARFLEETFSVRLCLDPDIVVGFAKDSSNLPGDAQALCRPASERECAAILRACSQAAIPISISGGRTNLTGSATPGGGVIVSTVAMLKPDVKTDAIAMTATVPVGALLEETRDRICEQSGGTLAFPVDPTSRKEASIGGCLSCNASGFTPGELGAFRHWVQSICIVFPDGLLACCDRGEIISENGEFVLCDGTGERKWPVPMYPRQAIKNAAGPYSSAKGVMDLIDLLIGSEGIFGLVTACTVKLARKPSEYLDLFFSLPSESEAIRFLRVAQEHFKRDLSGVSAFEYFGVHCRRYMTHEERFFRGDNQVGIYIQEPLFDKDFEDAAELWLELLKKADCAVDEESILLLDNDHLRATFLEARHSMPANALEVAHQRGAYTIMTDTVVPLERFPEFLNYTHGLLTDAQLDYLSFGHLGDCHLHFTILPEKAQIDAAIAAYDSIVSKSAELGGVYSGEHGTGKRKRKDFLRCFGLEAIEQIRRSKAAVDPQFLLNRGNLFEV